MKKNEKELKDSTFEFEISLNKASEDVYLLRLYVAGSTPQSLRAIQNIKTICEKNLKDRYTLEIVNLYENPGVAKKEQIIAAPTLVKKSPLPLRRVIGNLSDVEKVLVGLDLKKSL